MEGPDRPPEQRARADPCIRHPPTVPDSGREESWQEPRCRGFPKTHPSEWRRHPNENMIAVDHRDWPAFRASTVRLLLVATTAGSRNPGTAASAQCFAAAGDSCCGCGAPQSDSRVVGPANHRSISLGQRAEASHSRQRQIIWRCVQSSRAGNGHPGPAHVVPLAVAKWVG
jgi:hypothetical protein